MLHVVLAFAIATAIFVPISVYSELAPGMISVEINEKSFDIEYMQDGVDIQSLKPNYDDLSLVFLVEVTEPGLLEIDFLRSIFDKQVDGKDGDFFVFIEKTYYIRGFEKESTPELRRLMIDVPVGVKKFEIIGSFIGSPTLPPKPTDVKGPSSDTSGDQSKSSVVKDSKDQIMIDIADVTVPESAQIPDWIRNNAKWWSDGSIGDSDFVSGIQYLMEQGVIQIPKTEQTGGYSSDEIPQWIKENAGWWAAGLISDDDFVNGIQYLVQNGIIKV